LQAAAPLGADKPVPYYLATNCRIVRPVPAGAILTGADLELDESTTLVRLRREQDTLFMSG
jgi:predicted homoserine dehydrogenase-like protein